ncbi:MAG: hypothetical protein ACRDF6_01605 [bacterium]
MAVGEHGRAAFGEVEPALVQHGEVGDEGRGRLALALGEELHSREDLVIRELSYLGEIGRVHGQVIPWRFSGLQEGRGRSRIA